VPKLSALLILAALGGLLAVGRPAASRPSQQPPSPSQTTALLVASTNAPLRVLGSDGLEHLEYDLVFTNVFTAPVTLTAIEVLGPDGGTLLRLAGDALAASTQPVFIGPPSAEVPVAGTAATVIDLALAAEQVPARLTHRITYDLPTDAASLTIIGSRTINGPALTVDRRGPLMIGAPLRGDGWVTANGCCAAESIHRYIRLAVDGSHLIKPETFAIDWVRLQDGRLYTDDGSRNQQWFAFGADVVAATAGTVVAVRDDMPEETPSQPTVAVRQPYDYAGNHVVIQMAPTVWVTYAHLQTSSIGVAVGDQVTAGQLLGRLGNTGNSTGPHLHFQLADGPDVLTATSLPFVFDRYTLAGTINLQTAEAALAGTGGPGLSLEGAPQAQAGTYPLYLDVADFP
jgi:hypothetical protein